MSESIDPSGLPSFGEHEGNTLQLLRNGDEIFPAMLGAIRDAARSVHLETYVYWSGEIAVEFAEALAEAARRGVEVRVVLDWYGSQQMKEELVTRMERAGVKVRHFRPLRWFNLRRANHRSHRKLLIVDGRSGFLGGVGIAQEWTGHAQDPDHWRDNHYRVEGPVVADMQRLFFAHWGDDDIPARDEVDASPAAGDLRARLIASEPAEGPDEIEELYLELLRNAKRRFLAVAPYFAPSERVLEAMKDAAGRGVELEVIAAGRNNDMRVVRKAFRHDWGRLLEAGVRIFEYHRTLIHVKLIVVDDDTLLIGSANFDIRSLSLNAEACLLVRDGAWVERHARMFREDRDDAEEVSWEQWKNRPWMTKVKDGLSHSVRELL